MPTSPNLNDIPAVLGANIIDAFQQAAIKEIRSTTNKFFVAFTEAMSNEVETMADLTQANELLAREMQAAVVASYEDRVLSRERLAPYRVGQGRLSGGVLGRALADSGMVIATRDGIALGDREILDSQAAHWYRLNFGAGAKALSIYTGHGRVVRFGRNLGTIQLLDTPSSNPVLMPRGFWARPGGRTPPGFYPTGPQAYLPTQGIAGRRFFDAGVDVFAKRFPTVYQNVVAGWARQALKSAGPLKNSSVDVRLLLG